MNTIYNKYNLKATIEANKRVVDFLDVTLNLDTGKHHPHTKPNNILITSNSMSTESPTILPQSSEISPKASTNAYVSSPHIMISLKKRKPVYQKALKKVGTNPPITTPSKKELDTAT